MGYLSSYSPVTSLAGTDRFPLVTTPGVGGGNKYITATNLEIAIGGGSATTPEAFGAVRDGTTDDTTAFNAAQASLTAGGVVTLSKGIYRTKINPTKGSVTYKGAGMWATTLIPSTTTGFQIEWAAYAGDIAFEDMAFDSSITTSGSVAWLNGITTRNVRFTRCRFYNVSGGLVPQGLSGLVVEDCLFHTPGDPLRSLGIGMTAGTRKVKIRGNTFLYCNTGVSSITNCDDVTIEDNYFDQGWWLGASLRGNSGGTVTYGANSITDTAANFATLPSNGLNYFVRTMAARRTNSGGTVDYYDNLLIDTAASFVADGVMKGEIIRSGSSFAVVESVVSATTLQVEEWISNSTYLPVVQPSLAAAYTVHKVIVGFIQSGNATTLNIWNWHDLDGAFSTPSAGTVYEIIPHGVYPIHLQDCKGVKVLNNHTKRSWADQISLWGSENQVIGNTVEEGWDFGMTIHGSNNIVANNRVHHQGTTGITFGDLDSICIGNYVWGNQWVNTDPFPPNAAILIVGSGMLCIGNRVDGANRSLSHHGITYFAYGTDSVTGTLITGNHVTRCATAQICIDKEAGATIADVRLYGNIGAITRGATVAASVGDFRLEGYVGFYGTTPVAKPTGVAVSAAGIHAALVTLGLIAA